MQKGMSSLGTDVPSEREVNCLAARNEEEFWLFEQMDEGRRQRESVTAVLCDGRPEQRKAIREEYFGDGEFSVLLTHYDLIMKDKKYLNKVHWFYLIVDEGHRLKNHECALARTLVTWNKIKVTPKPLNATAKMLQPPLPLCQ